MFLRLDSPSVYHADINMPHLIIKWHIFVIFIKLSSYKIAHLKITILSMFTDPHVFFLNVSLLFFGHKLKVSDVQCCFEPRWISLCEPK